MRIFFLTGSSTNVCSNSLTLLLFVVYFFNFTWINGQTINHFCQSSGITFITICFHKMLLNHPKSSDENVYSALMTYLWYSLSKSRIGLINIYLIKDWLWISAGHHKASISFHELYASLTLNFCFLFGRYLWISFITLMRKPYASKLALMRSCRKQSKALVKSGNSYTKHPIMYIFFNFQL